MCHILLEPLTAAPGIRLPQQPDAQHPGDTQDPSAVQALPLARVAPAAPAEWLGVPALHNCRGPRPRPGLCLPLWSEASWDLRVQHPESTDEEADHAAPTGVASTGGSGGAEICTASRDAVGPVVGRSPEPQMTPPRAPWCPPSVPRLRGSRLSSASPGQPGCVPGEQGAQPGLMGNGSPPPRNILEGWCVAHPGSLPCEDTAWPGGGRGGVAPSSRLIAVPGPLGRCRFTNMCVLSPTGLGIRLVLVSTRFHCGTTGRAFPQGTGHRSSARGQSRRQESRREAEGADAIPSEACNRLFKK